MGKIKDNEHDVTNKLYFLSKCMLSYIYKNKKKHVFPNSSLN